MYTQINSENVGIPYTEGDIIPGYNHGDALHFSSDSLNHTMMHLMAKYLVTMYGNTPLNSVLDVGGGAGSFGFWLKTLKSDIEVVTLDGNRESRESPFADLKTHFIVRTDEEYTLMRGDERATFDVVVCFEHIEHIESDKFEQFMKNIHDHAHSNTIFFATASEWVYPEEDESHIHCNVKSLDEWRQYFKKQPYVLGSAIGALKAVTYENLSLQPAFIRFLVEYFDSVKDEFEEEIEAWIHRLSNSSIFVMGFKK